MLNVHYNYYIPTIANVDYTKKYKYAMDNGKIESQFHTYIFWIRDH